MANHIALIWGSEKQKYFCKWGWTANSLSCSLICPSGNHDLSAAVAARMGGAPGYLPISEQQGDGFRKCSTPSYELRWGPGRRRTWRGESDRYEGCHGL